MTELMNLPIGLIRTDGGTQIRACETFQTKVEEYALAIGAGAEFPPLTVFFDGTVYWLADGYHRHGAFQIVLTALRDELGVQSLDIPCEVFEGTLRDAILYACGANATHGIPRTNADKRVAIETMLTNELVAFDGNGVPWSDRQIGRICNVSHHTVAKIRAEVADGQIPNSRSYVKNGKTVTRVTGGGSSAAPKAEAEPEPEAPAPSQPKPQPEAESEPEPEPEAEPEAPAAGKVVPISSKWDYVHELMQRIDRAVAELPAPDVAATNYPLTMSDALTVKRVLELKRYVCEFARFWEARDPELQRYQQRQRDFIREEMNARTQSSNSE